MDLVLFSDSSINIKAITRFYCVRNLLYLQKLLIYKKIMKWVFFSCLKLVKTSNRKEMGTICYPVLSSELLPCLHANSRGKVWRHDGFQMDFFCNI